MDRLFTHAKQEFPELDDEDIMSKVQEMKAAAPEASEDELAQGITEAKKSEMVNDMVKKKYNIGDFSAEKRMSLANEVDESKDPLAAALAGFGAGLRGESVQSTFNNVLENSQANAKRKLSTFDKNKELALQERENDPMSEESVLAQKLAKDMGYEGDIAKLTAAQFKKFSPVMQKKFDLAARQQLIDQENQARRQSDQLKREEQQLKREEINERKDMALEEKMQAMETPYGLANSVDDAKMLKSAHESKNNFDSKINELIELRKTKGGEVLDRDAVNRAKQLSKELLLEYKNMAKLGVLSQSDENIINAVIPSDPLAFNSPLAAIQGQDPILSNLQKFKTSSDKDFATRVGTRTRSGLAETKEGMKQAAAETKVINGKTYQKVPGGWKAVK